MTAPPPLRLLLAGAGLIAVLGAAVHALRAESRPDTAELTPQPQPCSSCNARHARLKELRANPTKVQE